jgi:restriction endonuclease S subunit
VTGSWTPTFLGDVVRIKHGFAFSGMTENSDKTLPVVVGIGNFDYTGGFRFESSKVKRYVGEYPPEFNLSPGDLLLVMTCQTPGGEILGIPGIIPDDGQTYLHSQRLGKVEAIDPNRVYLPFIFQLARWRVFNHHLFATASGSKILHTSPGRIEEFRFDIPPLEEQRAIAATLGALDDKIKSNMRMVKLIPELISSSVEKELENNSKQIPVSDIAEFVNGGAYTKGASGDGRVVIRIAELNSGIGASTVYNNIEVPDNKTARVGDILMSWSGTLGVYVWTRADAIINQHIFKVLPEEYPSWLVFDRLNSVISEFRAIAADKATTMGHIRRDHLDSTLVKIPEKAGLMKLTEACTPLWNRYVSVQLEIHQLTNLRDALLPELMSGRIRVSEAAEVITREALR